MPLSLKDYTPFPYLKLLRRFEIPFDTRYVFD